MLPTLFPHLIIALSLTMTAPLFAVEKPSMASCQNIKNKIDHYTSLRRAGGSVQKMESWRSQKRKLQTRFGDRGCRQWRGKLGKVSQGT